VADRLWLVADSTCKPYDDDLEAYRNLIVQQRRKEREAEKLEARGGKQGKKSKDDKNASESEKQTRKLEEKVIELIGRKDAMENEIAVCCAGGDTHQLTRLNTTFADLQKELASAEAALESHIATS
jgi:ATP-binding cassette subfamily F protein 3